MDARNVIEAVGGGVGFVFGCYLVYNEVSLQECSKIGRKEGRKGLQECSKIGRKEGFCLIVHAHQIVFVVLLRRYVSESLFASHAIRYD